MDSLDRLLKYYNTILSKKQYTEYQLRLKARLKKYEGEIIEQGIQKLQALGLLHDTIVGEQLKIRYQGVSGKRKLSQQLKQAGLKPEEVNEVLEDFEETLTPGQITKIRRKYGHLEGAERKYTIMRYLMGRGFLTTEQLYEKYFN